MNGAAEATILFLLDFCKRAEVDPSDVTVSDVMDYIEEDDLGRVGVLEARERPLMQDAA
jgi:hypothetical protein